MEAFLLMFLVLGCLGYEVKEVELQGYDFLLYTDPEDSSINVSQLRPTWLNESRYTDVIEDYPIEKNVQDISRIVGCGHALNTFYVQVGRTQVYRLEVTTTL